jgi:hypothetical protein
MRAPDMETTAVQSSNAEWLAGESQIDFTIFQPTPDEREHLLSFLEAWDRMIGEQEKLMPMIDRLVASGDAASIEAAAKWFRNSPHAGRYHLIREWRRLKAEATTNN